MLAFTVYTNTFFIHLHHGYNSSIFHIINELYKHYLEKKSFIFLMLLVCMVAQWLDGWMV